jgi:hypothetical protein
MPLDADAIETLIDEVAAGSKSLASGDRSITAHDISQLIALENQRRARDAESGSRTRPGFGLRFQQINPVYR